MVFSHKSLRMGELVTETQKCQLNTAVVVMVTAIYAAKTKIK